MTVQEMLDIAGRYSTEMANAMVTACIDWAVKHNVWLRIPERPSEGRGGHKGRGGVRLVNSAPDDLEQEEWRRMVEGNSDTRYCHV